MGADPISKANLRYTFSTEDWYLLFLYTDQEYPPML